MSKIQKILTDLKISEREFFNACGVNSYKQCRYLKSGIKNEKLAKEMGLKLYEIMGKIIDLSEKGFDILEDKGFRKKALLWWSSLHYKAKKNFARDYYPEKAWTRLKYGEIEKIYISQLQK